MANHFDLTDLQLIVNIGDASSLTRGAEKSHLSLPAASNRVKNLEDHFGTRLFHRNSQGVTLTPSGEAFLRHARLVLRQIDHLRGDIHEYARGIKGQVRMLANTTAMTEFMPAVLSEVAFSDTLAFEYVGLSEWSAIHAFLIQAADKLGYPFRFRVEVGSFEAVCRMIEAGVGIGVVPELVAKRYAQRLNIKIVSLSDEWSERKLQICVRNLQQLPSFTRDLVNMLIEDVPAA